MFTYYCLQNHDTSILIIEEPELFLHPHVRRAISRRLDDFIGVKEAEGKQNQVIVTTHSEDIIQTSGAETISIVRSGNSGTTCHTLDFSEAFDDKEYKRLLKTKASETLFADKVILCEGEEEHFVAKACEILHDQIGYLDDYNISIVNVGGKKSLVTLAGILSKLNIEWYALADFDFLDDTCDTFSNNCGIENNISASIQKLHHYATTHFEGNIQEVFKDLNSTDFSGDGKIILEEVLEKFREQLGVWVLEDGKFEDYLTEEGQKLRRANGKIDPSKLLSVTLDDNDDITKYFRMDEYNRMLKRFLI